MGGNIKKLVKTVAPIALGSFLGPVGGSFVQAGLGKLISNPTVLKALSGAVSQGGTNLLTQKILGNKVDKRSAGISALMGGVAPFSSYVGNKFAGAKDGTFKKLLSEGGKDLSKRLSPFEIAEQGSTGLNRFKLRGDAGFKDIASKLTLDSTLGSSLAAYDAAKKSEEEFDKMMAGKTRTAAEDKAERVARITDSMKAAGFPQSRIDEVLIREGYAANGGIMYRTGGRVGLAFGGNPDDLLLELEEEDDTPSIIDQIKETGSISTAMSDPEDIPTLDNDLGEDEILQILKDGYAMGPRDGEPTGDSILDSLIEESIDEQKGRMMAGNRLSPNDIQKMRINFDILERGETMSLSEYLQSGLAIRDLRDNYKKGGRVGFAEGGTEDRNKMSKLIFQLANAVSDTEKRNILSEIQFVMAQGKKEGGIAGLKMGGMPSMEMDYRGGGFIPVGSKEKADDVPARLSKNEFVMTADAVRAAGGGSVNKGAQRMYQLMNGLEARV